MTTQNENRVLTPNKYWPDAPDVEIPHSDCIFENDGWNKPHIDSMLTLAGENGKHLYAGSNVIEVGSGNAINGLGLMTLKNETDRPHHYTGIDINDDAIKFARKLVKQFNLNASIVHSSLLQSVSNEQLQETDHIFHCIPQKADPDADLSQGDTSSHVYVPGEWPEWDNYGLGLVAGLTEEATERAPQASLFGNFAGRPSLEKLIEMHVAFNRQVKIHTESIVPQHLGTDIGTFVELKESEFFADANGQRKISAEQAKDIQDSTLRNNPENLTTVPGVYHKIYTLFSPGLT